MNRNRKMRRIKKILVPTDFSPPSNVAMDYAAFIAKQFNAGIILIHVIESLPYSVTDTFNVIEHRKALETTARSLLENFRHDLVERDLSLKISLVSGAAYQEILKKARQERIDLIVMGTHGRTGVRHLILGSVAEKVVRLSTCPVLTVRTPSGHRTASSSKAAKRPSITLY